MSIFLVGKNQAKFIANEARKIKDEIELLKPEGNVCSFKYIALKKQASKLETKARILNIKSPDDIA